MARARLVVMAATRLLGLVAVLCALFFLPAGTTAYREAWVYLGVLLVPVVAVVAWLVVREPGLLERRMQMRERERPQQAIVAASYPLTLLAFLIPGFDHRFGWSDVPAWAALAADLLVVLGYALFFVVLRANPYASRVVAVEPGQRVATGGPYALVRHPMYVGVAVIYVMSPLALGSWWAMIPGALTVPLLVARIRNEEAVLLRELEGYEEYTRTTRYRLVPGVW